ncbi:hypothetical protein LCGC14_2732490 [marine sediment metagenome]|uniref:VRR-NUC domain-containing protein n=1 Tax=marine sediment metagenome TaxID=412755 RepID=A0A0F9BFT3_9ZZZZ
MKEADLKRTVQEYLDWGQNQGRWLYLRLNAGNFIEVRGNTRRRVMGCQPGTSDFVVITNISTSFIELKSEKGKQSETQKEFQAKVEELGCYYFIIRSIEKLMEVLE